MNGILVGVLSTLVALAVLRALAVVARRRRWRRRGAARGFMSRRLLRRLGARPEQERLLLDEMEAIGTLLREARHGLFASREELAQLLEADRVETGALGEFAERQAARLDAVRRRATEGIARFHAALDAPQRKLLAEMVRSGGRHARAC